AIGRRIPGEMTGVPKRNVPGGMIHAMPDQPDRNQLAIQYRNRGEHEKADALFAETGVCEHLKPVEQFIRAQGGRITYVGTPWSRNCHNWVYFEGVVLDGEALRKRFALPEFVVTHAHL